MDTGHRNQKCLCSGSPLVKPTIVLHNFGLSLGKAVYSILPQSTQQQKWVPSINKAVLRACALYTANCSGISLGGLKWFPCVQCLLGEEGRVRTSVDTRLYKPNTFTFLYLYRHKWVNKHHATAATR